MQRFFLFFVFFLSCTVSSGFFEVKIPEFPLAASFSSNEFPARQTKPDHLKCTEDEECQSLILDSKCEDSNCRCGGRTVLSSDGSKCLEPAKEFGGSCEDNVQCSQLLSAGGSCIEKKCTCKPSYHYLRGFCWKNLGLHQKCQRDEQCFSDHEYIGLECKNRTCECRSGFYQRLRSGCRKIMEIGEKCNLDSDCVGKAKCQGMKCLNSFAFWKSVEIPGEEGAGDSSAEREKGSFELNSGSVRELGMSCIGDDDCKHILHAFCPSAKICGCEPPLYVASHDNRKCLKAARGQVEDITNSLCQEDVQCGVFGGRSVCLNKKCACKNGSYWEKSTKFCWAVKSLQESCSDNRDCHPSATHAECVHAGSLQVCRCQGGYHPRNLVCVPDALKVGDHCETKSDCLFPNSTCDQSSKSCECEDHYYAENGKCEPGIGSPCAGDADCAHLASTYCRKGNWTARRCSCLDNYTASESNTYCMPVVEYEGICTESFQCKFHLGDFGECTGGFCRCNGSAHHFHGRCYQSKVLGDPCSRKQDCFAGSDENSVVCFKGRCACHYDYVSDGAQACVKTNSGSEPAVHRLLLAGALALLLSTLTTSVVEPKGRLLSP